jgi:hypothetical protein
MNQVNRIGSRKGTRGTPELSAAVSENTDPTRTLKMRSHEQETCLSIDSPEKRKSADRHSKNKLFFTIGQLKVADMSNATRPVIEPD